MPASPHKILSKANRALVAWLISTGAATAKNCFPLKTALDKDLPLIIPAIDKWKQDDNNPGSYVITGPVRIETSAMDVTDTAATNRQPKDSDDISGPVHDAFFKLTSDDGDTTQLADAITAAARASATANATKKQNSDLACFKVDEIHVTNGGIEMSEDQAVWTESIDLELIVRPVTDTDP